MQRSWAEDEQSEHPVSWPLQLASVGLIAWLPSPYVMECVMALHLLHPLCASHLCQAHQTHKHVQPAWPPSPSLAECTFILLDPDLPDSPGTGSLGGGMAGEPAAAGTCCKFTFFAFRKFLMTAVEAAASPGLITSH